MRSRSSRALRNASGDEYVRWDTWNSSEGLQRPGDLRELGARDKAPYERLLCSLTQEVWCESGVCALIERARRRGDGDGAEPRAGVVSQVGVVKEHIVGHRQSPALPGSREREVGARREHIGQAVKREGRLVREDASAVRPEPDGGELLVFDVREVNEAVETPALVRDPTGLEVLLQELRRVAGLRRLARREEPRLGSRYLEECIPAWPAHTRNLTLGLSSRNAAGELSRT